MPRGPCLKSNRIFLRSLSLDDVTQKYIDWLNDSDVNRWLETRHEHQTLAHVTAFVTAKNASTDEYLFGIFLAEDSSHIGNIKIGPVRVAHGLGDISLFIGDRSAWGRGLGSEAIRLVTGFAFNTMGLRKIVAGMYAGNLGSAGAFRQAGYKKEVVLPRHYIHEGQETDLILYTSYAETWQ